ncbi:malonate decarboxylase, gamma subunit [Acinetobacter brisouii CIP 110357]|uniref:Malonate decarboxylase, gamma subunit n=1 Tax=Acinetobacter brisouii CIP 110357 TaxID=1341683 RepID=V2UM46_9GAMM|nr:biotin-independent malonate decarboxylase subunit gamma [Acinetobacter brisouii]ENV47969.1 malonate decarboxylase, gamma subunit [Acinetobacter brisouii ANC 4119]ESK51057.1 malonate decarboxylase, gamma subunit [Acinetobacter brisouii CIP 110357]
MNMDVNATRVAARGLNWFNALTAESSFQNAPDFPASLRVADGELNGYPVRVIAVVVDANNQFPRAQQGEVGLLEGWSLAKAVDQVIQADEAQSQKRAILCVVDVPSQAYGRREEVLGIYQALGAAADRYITARLAGHPVISLLVGKAMSGAFLAHGYQANRLIALDDAGVMVHAMGKESAARVTLRSVEELEQLAAKVAPMAYDIQSYHRLGLLAEILQVQDIVHPQAEDVLLIQQHVSAALQDILQSQDRSLSSRFHGENRQASQKVRALLREQWSREQSV